MYNNNGGRNNNGNTRKRLSKEDYEALKAQQIERQSGNLDMIDDVAAFLDDFLKNGEGYKVTMKDVLSYLNNEKNYESADTKAISQYSYLLMDLANARKNSHITGDRLNIRVLYIQERFKSSFKSELHEKALGIMKKYDTLFKWDDSATGEAYTTLVEKD